MLYNLPLIEPVMKKILAIRHKKSSVNNYRLDMPLGNIGATFAKELMKKDDVLTVGELAKKLKKKGEVWVIKYIDHLKTLDVLFSCRKAEGTKIVVDLDDNIWQIPFGNVAIGNPGDHANRIVMVTESVHMADWVTVSTKPLKDAIKKLNPKIAVLPNLINPDDWTFERKKNEKIRIGWSYSPTHIPDIPVVEDALREIYKKYKDKVEIVIFGTEFQLFDFPTTTIKAVKYDKYPKTFTEAGIDISIGPLENNDFNKCKSNIKWLESSMAGAAFVGSNVYPYKTSIENGVTGLIAKNKKEWVSHLSSLIEDSKLRKNLAKNAKKVVLEKYNLKTNKDWENFYKCL